MTHRPFLALALCLPLVGAASPALAQSAPGGAAAQPARAVTLSELRERSIQRLLDLSASSDPQVRANAIEGLDPAPARLEPIVALAVLDENIGVRTTALIVAGRHKIQAALSQAQNSTSDPSPFVRAAALYALKRLGQSPDLTPLASILLEDPEPRVRAHAAFLLGEIGEDSALPLLRQAATRPMPRASEATLTIMRLQIAEAMIKLGDDGQLDTLHAALFPSRPEDLESAALAAQILGEVGARRAVPDLINLALAKDDSGNAMPAEVRLAAARSVAMLGRRDGDFIAAEYASSDRPEIRAQVAMVLGDTADRNEIDSLAAMLEDPEPRVQVAAAAALLRATSRLTGR